MRVLILSTLAVASLAGAARAAETSAVQDMERLCVTTRAEPDAIDAILKAEHWEAAGPETRLANPLFRSGNLDLRQRARPGGRRVVAFGTGRLPGEGGGHPMLVCAVADFPADGTIRADLEADLGAKPLREDARVAAWAAIEHGGTRRILTTADMDDKLVESAADRGEAAAYVFVAQPDGQLAAYTRILPGDAAPAAQPAGKP